MDDCPCINCRNRRLITFQILARVIFLSRFYRWAHTYSR